MIDFKSVKDWESVLREPTGYDSNLFIVFLRGCRRCYDIPRSLTKDTLLQSDGGDVGPRGCLLSLPQWVLQFGEFKGLFKDTTLCVRSQGSVHLPPPQTLLFPVFQSCPLQSSSQLSESGVGSLLL